MSDRLQGVGTQLLERLQALPGGRQLLDLAVVRDDLQLVGGATRDLLLQRQPRELDVVVAGAAPSIAAALASTFGDSSQVGTTAHDRFGTALVSWSDGRIDIAERRAETYAAPGALPDVGPGTVEQDLQRRDFTVNAIAVALGGAAKGQISAVAGALEDLDAGRLRVLHALSFIEDPTRLLRLARYRVRLAFDPDDQTAALAQQAIAGGALATVSGARIGAELRLALVEPDPVATLQALDELGVLAALDQQLHLDSSLARTALALLPGDGRADLLLIACLLSTLEETDAPRALLDRLQFTAADRDLAADAASLAPQLVDRLTDAQTPSQLHQAVGSAAPEAVALAGALAEARDRAQAASAARRWLTELRHVRLQITGDDLLAAGVAEGPEIGRRLQLALRRKLDGELAGGREAELHAAIEGS